MSCEPNELAKDDMKNATPYCIVLTSTASEAQAETLARQIVEARLGACVQIQPIRSFYQWQGQLCAEPEWQLSIKTQQARYQELEQFILARHAYETPEIVQIPITAGSKDYLRWVDAGTQDDAAP
ncbi:divalent-cation tolerance protein CutA [Polaromonas jejuensis]|uniref:Divalent-cation tolerance protein CutA n=1 Tax=Polaromonas jejuensis TaxID=457502 RepID=A0ABW0Q502_9BURK|nr:divalent-cation tolerance protein CutA [Polaromonas jejuensis]